MRKTTLLNNGFFSKNTISKITASMGLCLALGFSSTCFAEFYAGGSVGKSQWDDVYDSKGTSFDIYGGFQFSEFLAAEIAFTDAGSFDVEDDGDNFDTEIVGANYSLVLMLPLDDSINIKGKISYLDYELERELNGRSIAEIQDGAINYSLGIDINVIDNLYVDVEYRYYPLEFNYDDEKVELAADNVSVGLRFTF